MQSFYYILSLCLLPSNQSLFLSIVSPGAGADAAAREKVEQDFARAVESMRRVYTVSQVIFLDRGFLFTPHTKGCKNR